MKQYDDIEFVCNLKEKTEFVYIRKAKYLSIDIVVKCMKIKKSKYKPEKNLKELVGECLFWSEVYFTKELGKSNFPHIVNFLDFYTIKNTLVLITEFIKGETLNDYFSKRSNNICYRDVYNIFFQICITIVFLQSKHIFHGDLHFGNIIISPIVYDCKYYHYKYNYSEKESVVFYIENLKYKIVVYDFGCSFQEKEYKYHNIDSHLDLHQFKKQYPLYFLDFNRIFDELAMRYNVVNVSSQLQNALFKTTNIFEFLKFAFPLYLDFYPDSKLRFEIELEEKNIDC
jgi:serine/threonine protein kinase